MDLSFSVIVARVLNKVSLDFQIEAGTPGIIIVVRGGE
jgi:hypothetical protein